MVLDAAVPDTPETRDLGEQFRAAKLVEVVVAFLDVVLDKPTVLVFEDVDEMDDSSAAIVTAAGGDRQRTTLAARRDPVPRDLTGLRLPEEVVVEEVELQPFDHAESVALLESWTVEEPVSRHLVEAIALKAGGNPLFMEALLDVARERGTVADLPDSLGAVVAGEIDRLSPRDRTVLRFASVLGDQFAFSSLHELVSDEGWKLEPGDLHRLDQFVQPEGDNEVWWRFANAVVRDAAYAGLPFRLRRRMHRHVGEVLEKMTTDPDEIAGPLAVALLGGRGPRPAPGGMRGRPETARGRCTRTPRRSTTTGWPWTPRCRSTACHAWRSPRCWRPPATSRTSPGSRARPSRRTDGRGTSPGPTPSPSRA